MAKQDRQEYSTTTRGGDKVRVIHGKNGNGETVSMQADGWGYDTLNVDPKRKGQ